MSDVFPAPRVCSEDGCEREVSILALGWRRCFLHRTIHGARWLTTEELSELREGIASVEPATAEEHRESRVRGRLASVESYAKQSQRAVDWAREGGATEVEITAAQLRGGLADVRGV